MDFGISSISKIWIYRIGKFSLEIIVASIWVNRFHPPFEFESPQRKYPVQFTEILIHLRLISKQNKKNHGSTAKMSLNTELEIPLNWKKQQNSQIQEYSETSPFQFAQFLQSGNIPVLYIISIYFARIQWILRVWLLDFLIFSLVWIAFS